MFSWKLHFTAFLSVWSFLWVWDAKAAVFEKNQRHLGTVIVQRGPELEAAWNVNISGTRTLNIVINPDGTVRSCKNRKGKNDEKLAAESCKILIERGMFPVADSPRKYNIIKFYWPDKKDLARLEKINPVSDFGGAFPISPVYWADGDTIAAVLRLTSGKIILPIAISTDENGSVVGCEPDASDDIPLQRGQRLCEEITVRGHLILPTNKTGDRQKVQGTYFIVFRDSKNTMRQSEYCTGGCNWGGNSSK